MTIFSTQFAQRDRTSSCRRFKCHKTKNKPNSKKTSEKISLKERPVALLEQQISLYQQQMELCKKEIELNKVQIEALKRKDTKSKGA